MEVWQEHNKAACTTVEQLQRYHVVSEPEALEQVAAAYPMRISPHLLKHIHAPHDALGLQFIPAASELDSAGEEDPLAEERLSPVAHLVHRYHGRVLLLCASSCFAYCRFCTRKRRVGKREQSISWGEVLQAIEYVAATPQINEVIVSGGDPLTMSDRLLQELLERLRRIPHVQVLRLGSRAPVAMPARITPKLCQMLQRFQPLYFLTHINHPAELNAASLQACAMLVEAGIPVVNQTVLLRGVNDSPEILLELFERLLRLRIRPYYLHQMDLTSGTGHFRTRLEDGIAIMAALRGRLSGLAMPHYVVDLPGGHGKIPLVPEYIDRLGPDAQLRAADGTVVPYPNVTGLQG